MWCSSFKCVCVCVCVCGTFMMGDGDGTFMMGDGDTLIGFFDVLV